MRKTAEELANHVLEKTALRRVTKELIRQAEKYIPGVSKDIRKMHRIKPVSGNEAMRWDNPSEAFIDTLSRVTPQRYIDQQLSPQAAKKLKPLLDQHAFDILGERAWAGTPRQLGILRKTKFIAEGAKKEDLLRAVSGRHRPRPGEFVIPAAGPSAEMTAQLTPQRTPYLYRGNPFRAGESVVSSAHPDVAAGYAVGAATQSKGIPTNRLYALRRKGLNTLETYGDYYRPQSVKHPRWEDPEKFTGFFNGGIDYENAFRSPTLKKNIERMSKKVHTRQSRANPTYETIISKDTAPRIAGEYDVRPVRLEDGTLGYGLTRVKGIAPHKAFGPFEIA